MKKVKFAHLLLLFVFTFLHSCKNEDYFTEEQLNKVDVYSKGDEFLMTNLAGDTLNFIIKDRIIENKEWNCAECFGPTLYEELNYPIDITLNDSITYHGNFFTNSQDEWEKFLQYDFFIGNSNYFGSIDVTQGNDSTVINGIMYKNINCDNKCCFSKEIGFIKFGDFFIIRHN